MTKIVLGCRSMSVLVNSLVLLYVLYEIKAPLWLFAVVIASTAGDLIHAAYRAGGEANVKDRE